MKNPFLLFAIVAIMGLMACSTPAEDKAVAEDRAQAEETGPLAIYPTKKVDSLMQATISQLNTASVSDAEKDTIFIKFLEVHTKMAGEFTKILIDNDPNYENNNYYNQLINEFGEPDSLTKKFKEKMVNCGFSFNSSEGFLYLDIDPSFMQKTFFPYISKEMQNLFSAYGKEVEQPCCDDAAIIITMDELTARTLDWEKLSDQYPDITLGHQKVSRLYHGKMMLLMTGTDNTPAFWNKKLNKEFLHTWEKIIADYPETKTAKSLKEYVAILKNNGNKLTDEVKDFIYQ